MTCEAYLCTQVRDEFYWKYRTSNSTKRDRYVGKKIQASKDSKMFIFIRSVRIRFLCAIIRPLDCRVKSTSLAASQPRGNVTDIWNVAMCSSRIVNLSSTLWRGAHGRRQCIWHCFRGPRSGSLFEEKLAHTCNHKVMVTSSTINHVATRPCHLLQIASQTPW